jgi:hypothetical protein
MTDAVKARIKLLNHLCIVPPFGFYMLKPLRSLDDLGGAIAGQPLEAVQIVPKVQAVQVVSSPRI